MIQRQINLKKKILRKPLKNFRVQRSNSRIPSSSKLIPNVTYSKSSKSTPDLTWAEARALAFLNAASKPSDITNGPIRNYSSSEKGYTIGQTVAKRILEKRNSLPPFRQFRSLKELEDIQGLGKDKLQDLLKSMSLPADQLFYDQLFESILLDNWKVNYYSIHYRSETDFQQLVQHKSNLIAPIAEKVATIADATNRNEVRLAQQLLQQTYIERFESPEKAAIALAFWFYQFDEDNWFSFERMRTQTSAYFNYNISYQHRLELVLFKGFPNYLIAANGITPVDLPVVINYAEQKITIWTAALFD